LSGAGPGLGGGVHVFDDKENARVAPAKQAKAAFGLSSVKRDFFGRVMPDAPRPLQDVNVNGGERRGKMEMGCGGMETKAWVTFHEGLNNAVKKPISLDEFLRGL
jgi:chromosome transmission fidelity protein 18